MTPDVSSLRIGLDAREAFRENPRGIGLYARHLVREFGSLCPETEFLLYHERPNPPDLPPIPKAMRPVRATCKGDRFLAWERLLMPWRIRRDALSVYHGTYNTLPPQWPLWKGPPMVVSIHDLIVVWHDEDLHDPYIRYCRQATRRFVRDAAHILTVSEWSKRDILERYPVDPSKITVFYNGVHPDFLAGAPEGAGLAARTKYAGGRPYLFAVGAPLPRKNTGRMLEALGLLHARKPLEHRILVSGLGTEAQQKFGAIAGRVGLADQVRFLPYVSRSDLVGLYAGADLSIYPSLVEGWGIPVIESLVLGTPVITSNTSGMAEAAGPHGHLFDPTNLDSMVEGIAQAIADRARFASIRDEAVQRARTFTWRRAAEVTLQVYQQVAR